MDGGEMLDRFLPQASELQKKHLLKQQGERYRRAELHRVRAFAGVRDLFARLKQEGRLRGRHRHDLQTRRARRLRPERAGSRPCRCHCMRR
jgi:hypothetical protein